MNNKTLLIVAIVKNLIWIGSYNHMKLWFTDSKSAKFIFRLILVTAAADMLLMLLKPGYPEGGDRGGGAQTHHHPTFIDFCLCGRVSLA